MTLIELVQACRKATKEHEALRFAGDLVSEIGPSLWEFISRQTRSDLAEDVYQETLIAIGQNVGKCRAKDDKRVRRWCFGIAVHKMVSSWRREKSHPTLSLDVETVRQAVEASGKDRRIESEERAELNLALELVGAADPACVDYLWEGIAYDLAFKDTGVLHGQSTDAARMRVNRCLELAQKLVSKKMGGVNG